MIVPFLSLYVDAFRKLFPITMSSFSNHFGNQEKNVQRISLSSSSHQSRTRSLTCSLITLES